MLRAGGVAQMQGIGVGHGVAQMQAVGVGHGDPKSFLYTVQLIALAKCHLRYVWSMYP